MHPGGVCQACACDWKGDFAAACARHCATHLVVNGCPVVRTDPVQQAMKYGAASCTRR